MQEQVQQRLEQLRSEFEAGQRMLAELDARRADLQQTLLRIGGAVQVLEELLGEQGGAAPASEGTQADDSASANGRVAAGVP
jgi:hypothetical protein